MDALEARVLGRILLCDTMDEQIDFLLKLAFVISRRMQLGNIYRSLTMSYSRSGLKIDQLSLYEYVKFLDGFNAAEFSRLTEGLNHD